MSPIAKLQYSRERQWIPYKGGKRKISQSNKQLQKMFIEPPCKAEKESHEDKDSEGCTVLVKGRDITDRDGFGTGWFHLDSVGADDLFLTPTRVPLMDSISPIGFTWLIIMLVFDVNKWGILKSSAKIRQGGWWFPSASQLCTINPTNIHFGWSARVIWSKKGH